VESKKAAGSLSRLPSRIKFLHDEGNEYFKAIGKFKHEINEKFAVADEIENW